MFIPLCHVPSLHSTCFNCSSHAERNFDATHSSSSIKRRNSWVHKSNRTRKSWCWEAHEMFPEVSLPYTYLNSTPLKKNIEIAKGPQNQLHHPQDPPAQWLAVTTHFRQLSRKISKVPRCMTCNWNFQDWKALKLVSGGDLRNPSLLQGRLWALSCELRSRWGRQGHGLRWPDIGRAMGRDMAGRWVLDEVPTWFLDTIISYQRETLAGPSVHHERIHPKEFHRISLFIVLVEPNDIQDSSLKPVFDNR